MCQTIALTGQLLAEISADCQEIVSNQEIVRHMIPSNPQICCLAVVGDRLVSNLWAELS